ncbi:MAG: ABC transporter permease [Bacillota bacterium]|nr:ABC transporter permease [Bacillota bacterium]
MLRRLLNLMALDAKLLWRNKFFHASLLLAIIFILLVNFAIPSQVKVGIKEYIYDGTSDKIFADFLAQEVEEQYVTESEAELRQLVAKDSNSVGIILAGTADAPQATIIQQGFENPKAMQLLAASIDAIWVEKGGVGREAAHQLTMLRPQVEEIPFNLSLLPIFIALESIVVGFYFAAVTVFQEKEEGGIKAYRSSPGGSLEYILSKVLIYSGLALLYTLLVVVATVGLGVNYGQIILLIFVAAALLTFLGLAIGVFFDNLSSFIYPAFVLMAVMSLPMGAYFFPALNISFYQLITTYPVMFGLREAIFPTGNSQLFHQVFMILIPQLVVAGVLCFLLVKKRLIQEVG